MNKTIIVKVGTESLVNFHKSEKVTKMVGDIARLIQEKISVVLISSGAVGCGRELFAREENKHVLASVGQSMLNNQVLASVGQPILMARYAEKFREHRIITAQVLPTHATLEELQSHREQFVLTLNNIMRAGVLPIINENDPLSTIEMRELGRGADNDQNALLTARYISASEIVLITNTNGTYADKDDTNSRINILQGTTISEDWIRDTCGEKSETGTGGMQSKLRIGRSFAEIGGITHICDGLTTGVYEHVIKRDNSGGTTIIA